MMYDKDFIDHLRKNLEATGQDISPILKLYDFLIKFRIIRILINLLENILGFILALPIPIYADLMEVLIKYFPGSPYYLGNYLRAMYYAKKLKHMGRNVIIEEGVTIFHKNKTEFDEFVLIDKFVLLEAKEIKIGRRVHLSHNCSISGNGKFIMENYSCLSHSSTVVTATEVPNKGARTSGPMAPINQRNLIYEDVIIKKDAFVGMSVILQPGVIIGEGAVVGSGSVVTKNIEPWTIVVGVPAKKIGERERIKHPDI